MTTTVFYANWGPRDGPILGRDNPPALGVFRTRDTTQMPIGTAFPVGLVPHPRGPAKTFRIVVDHDELEGRWICEDRVFLRLGEAAEEL